MNKVEAHHTIQPAGTLPKKVAVLAYDQLCTFEYGIAIEVFDTIQSKTAPLYQAETGEKHVITFSR